MAQPASPPFPQGEQFCYINGRFIASDRRFHSISPVDGSVVAEICEADADMVAEAVEAGRAAMRGPWGKTDAPERAALLERIAAGIEARFEDFVAAEVADTGRPEHLARTLDVPRAIANFRTFAAIVEGAHERMFTSRPGGQPIMNYVVRQPLGVVGIISPWNLPILLLTWKVAPALACGNCVVVKPSEETPSSASLLAQVCHDAGVPPGVFNLVHGFGAGSAGEALTAHPNVDAITFTGETRTGTAIMRNAASGVRPVSFELGGKNAALIFADADLEAAIAGTVRSAFTNSGQVCLCTERIYVERRMFDSFVAGLESATQRLRLGLPDDPATDLGPLISHAHREKVLGYYALAIEEGARVIAGGGAPRFGDVRDRGAYVEPTIWTGLPQSARCMQEEIFGPVCHIAPFDTEDEAVALANDTAYGLASCIWTSDLRRGHRVARRMRTGMVWVNSWYLRDLRTPFGGMKLSGIGREGGEHSLDFYSEITNVCLAL